MNTLFDAETSIGLRKLSFKKVISSCFIAEGEGRIVFKLLVLDNQSVWLPALSSESLAEET